ncbi:MAG: enoyl-CoA hydratase-related protein, partial [Bacteroidota bacterium]|nr:enoyl-CoA hydratase-related protein [Bacteroidota bacterium]
MQNVKHDYRYIEIQLEDKIARISLNRPERHNALILEMIAELDQALDEISGRNDLLFMVLSGNGRSFCAGADLNWFYGSDENNQEENAARYKHLADLLLKLYQLPLVTIACTRGNVFGGGIGLMAACDFVLAEANTRFMFSEVKLGLLPATILPFVAKRLSVQNLRKWILTGSLFNAPEAHQAGLVDILYEEEQLEKVLLEFLTSFDSAAPSAVKRAKTMINQVTSGTINVNDTALTAVILAEALSSPDGQEGIRAFLEKRKPEWSPSQTLPEGEG